MSEYKVNPQVQSEPDWSDSFFDFLKSRDMLDFHKSLEGYAPTALRTMPELAAELGLGAVFVKDESTRFGIKAFKALGASYAIYRCLKQRYLDRFGEGLFPRDFSDPQGKLARLGSMTFCAATDGNHGRAVAWTAGRLGQKAVIYMPDNTAKARIENIEAEGAKAELVPGTFDDCVRRCARDAEANRWQVISDTAYQGYMEIPKYIMLGYSSLFYEMDSQLHDPRSPNIELVLLQTGVGGLTAAGASFYTMKYGAARPKLLCVEPVSSDCFLESVKQGKPSAAKGAQDSIMAGLNCGEPSLVAWPIIRDSVHAFFAIEDTWAFEGMRRYYAEGIISGESGASGLAGLLALYQDRNVKNLLPQLNLPANPRVLLINTEGDTDPENYRQVVHPGR